MEHTTDLARTFHTVAEKYEKMRPGYVPALYQDLFAYRPIDSRAAAMEIGIGSGQATLPILRTGCQVTAVEPSENLARICREKFRQFPGFQAVTDTFEQFPGRENCFDLIYAATSFHWIPENIGYPKVYALLKRGGAFARFANHPYRDKGNPALAEKIDRIYQAYYHKFYPEKQGTLQEYDEQAAARQAEIALNYGFTDIAFHLYRRTRTFSSKEYVELLGTYSDHIAIEESIRTPFFAEIEAAIEEFGGNITIYDTIDLQLARKP